MILVGYRRAFTQSKLYIWYTICKPKSIWLWSYYLKSIISTPINGRHLVQFTEMYPKFAKTLTTNRPNITLQKVWQKMPNDAVYGSSFLFGGDDIVCCFHISAICLVQSSIPLDYNRFCQELMLYFNIRWDSFLHFACCPQDRQTTFPASKIPCDSKQMGWWRCKI